MKFFLILMMAQSPAMADGLNRNNLGEFLGSFGEIHENAMKLRHKEDGERIKTIEEDGERIKTIEEEIKKHCDAEKLGMKEADAEKLNEMAIQLPDLLKRMHWQLVEIESLELNNGTTDPKRFCDPGLAPMDNNARKNTPANPFSKAAGLGLERREMIGSLPGIIRRLVEVEVFSKSREQKELSSQCAFPFRQGLKLLQEYYQQLKPVPPAINHRIIYPT